MLNKSLPQLQKIISLLKRYVVILCIIAFGGMYGYLVYTAGQQAQIEPSQKAVDDAYKANSRPKLDKDTAEKLKSLEASNIEVQALFEEARNNPFAE